jgi:hypothetical protein
MVYRFAMGIVLLGAACAHGAASDTGYAGWHAVTTEHFLVNTPLGAGDAEETAARLEQLYQALERGFFPRARLERIDVVVFERQADASRDAPGAHVASDTSRGPAKGPLVLVRRDGRRDRGLGTAVGRYTTPWQRAAARALGRRFLDGALVRTPAWLEVGLGRYLATVELEPDAAGAVAIFGRRPDDLAAELRQGRAIPLGQVLAAGTPELQGDWGRDYQASAWGFIHYLLDGEKGTLRPRFDAMMSALLAGGGQTDSRAAVAQAFPDLPFPVLEAKVRDYAVEVLGRRPSFHPYPVALVAAARTAGTATPSDPAHLQAVLARHR